MVKFCKQNCRKNNYNKYFVLPKKNFNGAVYNMERITGKIQVSLN